MCGIAGLWSPSNRDTDSLRAIVAAMTASIVHRGPDGDGNWVEAEAGLAVGHRRLAIIDLGATGRQPMASASGRYVVTYNGEIYNFRALRKELAGRGCSFRGTSDTEVLLALIEAVGLPEALQRANGMFALALWDRTTRRLHLVRDRFGQKPLYYGRFGTTFAFASELRAFRHLPGFSASPDRGAVALLLRHGAIPAPYTIYGNCRKLTAGSVLTISADDFARGTLPNPVPYWSATDAAANGCADPLSLDDEAAADALEALLQDAVRSCMVSDVPLGAFLSGGIDSSTVVALMQAQSSRPIRTFSIGFTEAAYNEATDAAQVAAHLGTDHTEFYVSPADAQAVIPALPQIYDEPFADSSQVPTFLVSRLAREHVTVSLSGDGGDELFGGYNRYTWARNLDRTLGLLPHAVRRCVAHRAKTISPASWDSTCARAIGLFRRNARQDRYGDKVHKLAEIIDAPSREAMYWRLVSQWKQPDKVLIDATEPPTRLSDQASWPVLPSFIQQIMLLDSLVYLPDDILVKLDRAGMAVSLETRVPLLDHRLFEFAWRLPAHQKIRRGSGKWILREVLARHVPRALFERPKMGFGVPIGDWLRTDLRAWADDLLSPEALRAGGYFHAGTVAATWHEHLSGRRNHQHALWPILMFEAWRREQPATGLRA
jgi:asparagine synthase (glutamine-hydrolysing)